MAETKPKEVLVPPEPKHTVEQVDLSGTYQEMIPVNLVKPNKYNCNVMSLEQYEAMKNNMAAMKGPKGMEPILVRTVANGYEIVNGEHRWKAAIEIGRTEILADIFPKGDITEDQALALNFRINRQRGKHDPKREAAFFKYRLDSGITQAELAKELGIDRTTISHRLNILKIEDKVLDQVPEELEVPVSILEVVSTLPTSELQEKVLDMFVEDDASVSQIERQARNLKENHKEQLAWEKELKSIEHPSCPECGKKAKGWWEKPIWLQCKDWHKWSAKTGKKKPPHVPTQTTKSKPAPKIVRAFRTEYTAEEIRKAGIRFALEFFKEHIDKIDGVRLSVEGGGWYEDIEVKDTGLTVGVHINSEAGRLSITGERKTYSSPRLKMMNTAVSVSEPSPTLKEGPSKGGKLFKKLMNGILKPKPKKKASKKKLAKKK